MNARINVSGLQTDTLAQIVADLRNSPYHNDGDRELEIACEQMLKREIQNDLVVETMIDEECNRLAL